MNTWRLWYKDSQFQEIKAADDDVVCTMNDPEELARVVDEHNLLLNTLAYCETVLSHAICIGYLGSGSTFGMAEEAVRRCKAMRPPEPEIDG